MKKKLAVIGGGAAGFFCAVNSVEKCPDLEVVIFEKTNKLMSKVKISGGGRCNVTHACFRISEMVKNYPRGKEFLKRAFHHFFTNDTISWFEQRKIKLKTEPDGRMFPVTDSSDTIISCLLNEANEKNISIVLNHEIVKIDYEKNNSKEKFVITGKNGQVTQADFICISCGGFHKRSQYDWMHSLSHAIENPVPSLFTFNIPKNPITSLMGISVNEATVKINGTKFLQQGPLLVTHWGLSGPAILKLSAFAAIDLAGMNYDFTISINWIPAFHENSALDKLKSVRNDFASKKISNYNPFELPQRLWQHLLITCEINPEVRWADLPAKQQNLLAKTLCSQSFHVKGKTTFKEEFVTAGGIILSEVNPDTMESRIIPDLFFAGEILNVDGITGGFNFQHAWTSGWIAAKTIAEKCAGSL